MTRKLQVCQTLVLFSSIYYRNWRSDCKCFSINLSICSFSAEYLEVKRKGK